MMKKPDKRTKIFVDASMLIGIAEEGIRTEQIKLNVLKSHEDFEILTTDVTIIEVARKRADNSCKKLWPLADREVRRLARNIFSHDIPEIEKHEISDAAYDYHRKQIAESISHFRWRCLECNAINLLSVFEDYGKRARFFRDEAKKGQFADAIIFQMLEAEATAETPVIIGSRDKDFRAVCEFSDNFTCVQSWGALFEELGWSESIPELECIVNKYKDLIVSEVLERVHLWDREWWEYEGMEYKKADVRGMEIAQLSGISSDNTKCIFGEMGIFCDIPQATPKALIKHWKTMKGEAIVNSDYNGASVCDVFFAIVYKTWCGTEAKFSHGPGILELEFGDGEFAFMELP